MVHIQPSETLRKAITKSRPDLKEISLNSYITSLRSLFKRLNPNDDLKTQLNTKFLHDKKEIMKDVDKQVLNTKKNIISAILVALGSDIPKPDKILDSYQITLKELAGKYNDFIDSQQKSESQQKNWISYSTFIDVLNGLLDDVKKYGIQKKEKLTRTEYTILQKYVILSFYQTFPMRNDVADMAVITQKEYDDLKDDTRKSHNYFVKTDNNKFKMYLNQFKNVSRIGAKTFEIPDKLAKIVKLWLKHNKSGWLFTLGNARDPLNANGITKLLNSIFEKACNGKKISSSMLRHISISEKLKGEPTLLEKKADEKKTEDLYMHSVSMNNAYRKID